MSDTPRTDSRLTAILDADGFVDQSNCPQRWVNHGRELERELNAANDRIKRLEEFVDQLTNPKFTRDDLPKEALLQRIKRLEEAGDALKAAGYFGGFGDAVNKWLKAKEDKP